MKRKNVVCCCAILVAILDGLMKAWRLLQRARVVAKHRHSSIIARQDVHFTVQEMVAHDAQDDHGTTCLAKPNVMMKGGTR